MYIDSNTVTLLICLVGVAVLGSGGLTIVAMVMLRNARAIEADTERVINELEDHRADVDRILDRAEATLKVAQERDRRSRAGLAKVRRVLGEGGIVLNTVTVFWANETQKIVRVVPVDNNGEEYENHLEVESLATLLSLNEFECETYGNGVNVAVDE